MTDRSRVTTSLRPAATTRELTVSPDPLYTPLCDRLDLDVPILLAGMGTIAMRDLVVAVSEAGGLGFLGAVGLNADELSTEIDAIQAATDRPFGVDLFLPPGPPEQLRAKLRDAFDDNRAERLDEVLQVEQLVDLIVDSGAPHFASALGNPGWMVDRAHAAGMTVFALVGTVKQAVACVESGVDVIVAQGYDAGGHTGRIGTLSLVPQVVDAVDVPVVAAGGITDGRGIAAALALGAQAVWLGTRFVATQEAIAMQVHKQRITQIGDDDTTITRAYTGKPARMIRNRYVTEWEGREDEIAPFPVQMVRTQQLLADAGEEDGEMRPMPAGQASGLIKDLPTAAEVVDELATQARDVLRRIAG